MPKPTNLENLIIQALCHHGFDGLYDECGECACLVNDLAPGSCLSLDCLPGYRVDCDCGEHDFHVVGEKAK